jgi:hypothetical protein
MRIGWGRNKVGTACKFSFLALYKACNSAFLFDVAITEKEKTSAPLRAPCTEIGGRWGVPKNFGQSYLPSAVPSAGVATK